MNKSLARNIGSIALAGLGALLVWCGTNQGAGVGGDATIYLTSAQNFADGMGLGLITVDGSFRLIPYFPPFFPLVLSVFAALNLDLALATRLMNILLFAGTIYLVVRTTDNLIRDWRFSVAVGLLLATSPVLIPAFSWVMSEPLSIFLGTLALILCLKALQNPQKTALLHISAVLAGLSTITRYGAIAYTGTACLLILVYMQGAFGRRMLRAVIYGIEAVIPLGVWAVIDILLTSTVSSRSVNALADMGIKIAAYFSHLKSVILFWLIPDSWIQVPFYPTWVNTFIFVIFLILIAVGCWFVIKKSKASIAFQRLCTMLMIFSVLYVLMTMLISAVTYPPITIGTRMFSPMYLMVIWLMVLMLYRLSQAAQLSKWISMLILAGTIGLVIWSGWRGLRIVNDNSIHGLGFQSVSWQASELVSYIETLPEEQILVSNEEMALLYLAERKVYPFAEIYYDEPLQSYSSYGEGQSETESEAQFKEHGAYLVLFDSVYEQLQGLYGARTGERVSKLTDGLQLIYQGQDGKVYQYPLHIEE